MHFEKAYIVPSLDEGRGRFELWTASSYPALSFLPTKKKPTQEAAKQEVKKKDDGKKGQTAAANQESSCDQRADRALTSGTQRAFRALGC